MESTALLQDGGDGAVFRMSLPNDLDQHGRLDRDLAMDEQSLSFSSSSGEEEKEEEESSSKSSTIDLPSVPTTLDEIDHIVNVAPAPIINVMDSLKHLYVAHLHSESNISTSANTAVMSNKRRDSDRGRNCASPPNCLLSENNNSSIADSSPSKRSIFGRQAQKKYNVRRNESPGVKFQQSSHLTQQSPLSDLAMEASIPTPEESPADPIFDVPFSPINPITHKTTALTPPHTPGDKGSNPPPPLQTVGYQNLLTPNLSPLTPLGRATYNHNIWM